ncbi:transporter EamA [Gluconacetobacter sacchari DSM 12717]|uniref:EamA family transporter n=2 Tax=Gluconacetobacter sacchari TaxID=92759 RepID=A0A7W4I9S3_9PROT|nr:EamA family transporter [Gluconacetobacter sacchari]MBB2158905.1 EamA family transporter [Gluconacetobacter sacchari]GBQ22412.1 transporter EamA [Gluconacetobacter sacchari DSM 12717]
MTGPAPGPAGEGQAHDPLGGILLVVGGMVSFQVGGSFAKLLFPVFGPLGTVGLRLWIAAIVLGILTRPWRAAPDRATLKMILWYGAAIGVMNMSFYLSLARLPLGVTVAVEFLGPLTLSLSGARRAREWLLFPMILGGLYLLLQPGAALAGRPLDLLGVAYGLMAAAGWAAYIVAGGRVSRRIDAARATALGQAVGAVLVTPMMMATLPAAASHPHAALLACFVAVLSSALPYTLEMLAMKRLHPRQFGILTSLDPAVAAIIGLVLLGEHLAPAQWAGILCIVLSSIGGVMIQRPGLAPAPALPEM